MHKIFFFIGIILLAVGITVYFALGTVTTYNGGKTMSPELKMTLQLSIGGFLSALGIIFLVVAFRSKARAAKQQAENLHILQTGIAAEGTVTFVDKNYAVRVNKVPVFSIVEYTYKDRSGNVHTRRINNFSSEMVIRKQIQVGGKIPVKYSNEDAGKSVIVL